MCPCVLVEADKVFKLVLLLLFNFSSRPNDNTGWLDTPNKYFNLVSTEYRVYLNAKK